MSERQPTLEQVSHFTTLGSEGEAIEVEVIYKFYVSPKDEAPSETSKQVTVEEVASEAQGEEETGRGLGDRKLDSKYSLTNCPTRQFVPDPCQAMTDIVTSFRNSYNNYFFSNIALNNDQDTQLEMKETASEEDEIHELNEVHSSKSGMDVNINWFHIAVCVFLLFYHVNYFVF